MSRVVVDAGPCLNFLSLVEGDLLHEVLSGDGSALLAPEEVAEEIRRKSLQTPALFGPALRVFDGMRRVGKFRVLESDYDDDDLFAAIESVTDRPIEQLRQYAARDLGEIMAVAHAVVLRDAGHDVALLLEDGGGRLLAADAGFTRPISSMRVLATAARTGRRDMAQMRKLYDRMRPLDGRFRDRPWEQTPLSDPRLYRATTRI